MTYQEFYDNLIGLLGLKSSSKDATMLHRFMLGKNSVFQKLVPQEVLNDAFLEDQRLAWEDIASIMGPNKGAVGRVGGFIKRLKQDFGGIPASEIPQSQVGRINAEGEIPKVEAVAGQKIPASAETVKIPHIVGARSKTASKVWSVITDMGTSRGGISAKSLEDLWSKMPRDARGMSDVLMSFGRAGGAADVVDGSLALHVRGLAGLVGEDLGKIRTKEETERFLSSMDDRINKIQSTWNKLSTNSRRELSEGMGAAIAENGPSLVESPEAFEGSKFYQKMAEQQEKIASAKKRAVEVSKKEQEVVIKDSAASGGESVKPPAGEKPPKGRVLSGLKNSGLGKFLGGLLGVEDLGSAWKATTKTGAAKSLGKFAMGSLPGWLLLEHLLLDPAAEAVEMATMRPKVSSPESILLANRADKIRSQRAAQGLAQSPEMVAELRRQIQGLQTRDVGSVPGEVRVGGIPGEGAFEDPRGLLQTLVGRQVDY